MANAITFTYTGNADNAYKLFVNGERIIIDRDWRTVETATLELEAGDVVAVKAWNTGGGARALFDFDAPGIANFGSSAAWLVTDRAGGPWKSQGYDDSDWEAATIVGTAADRPWANSLMPALPSSSTASWIWTDEPRRDAQAFFRFTVPDAVVDPAIVPQGEAQATISANVDNAYELFVNGRLVLADDVWNTLETATTALAPGDVIAISATNAGGQAAALVDVNVPGVGRFGTSSDWLVTDQARGDWTAADYDDSDWEQATTFGGVNKRPWAKHIAPELASDSQARWVWTDDNRGDARAFFRFTIPEPGTPPNDPAEEATLTVRVDNAYELFVNGALVLADDFWKDAEVVTIDLASGDVIALRAENTGGAGGAFVDIAWAGARLGSSADWQLSERDPGRGWTREGFDDSDWQAATEYGGVDLEPWASRADGAPLPAGSPAQWIWSDDQRDQGFVYFRYVVEEPRDPPPAGGLTISYQSSSVAKIVDLRAGFTADAARVLPLGDSITDGFEVGKARSIWDGYRGDLFERVTDAGLWVDYVGQYERGPDTLADRDHQGKGGIKAIEVAPNATAIAEAHDPDIVLLKLGTNDVLRDANADDVVPDTILDIIEDIAAVVPDAHILVSELAPLDPDVYRADLSSSFRADGDVLAAAVNDQLPGIVAQARAQGIEASLVRQTGLSDSAADLGDGVHPTDQGYATIADNWFDALNDDVGTSARTFAGDAQSLPNDVQNVTGSAQGDLLVGNGRANRLDGAGGNDRLDGAGGDDVLTGGNGDDVFVASRGDDIITDFRANADRIDVDRLLTGANDGNLDRYLQITASGSDSRIAFDLDGSSGFANPDATLTILDTNPGSLDDPGILIT